MPEIEQGTSVAHVHHRQTMMGRVRRPPRHGKASVYWVRRGIASSVRLDLLVPIKDAELVAFLEQQEALYARSWNYPDDPDRPAWIGSIAPPSTKQPEHVQDFIRSGKVK